MQCAAAQIQASIHSDGVGGGHHREFFLLRNVSTEPCWLSGYPDLAIVDSSGRAVLQAAGAVGAGTYFDSAPIVKTLLDAGTPSLPSPSSFPRDGAAGQAFVNFEWYDCRSGTTAAALLTLPGGGRLSVPYAVSLPAISPACPNALTGAPASVLRRGPVTPSAWNWAPTPVYIPLHVTSGASPTARRGKPLDFTVTISNAGLSDYSLNPCPDYIEDFGPKPWSTQYQLNCASVGSIRAGQERTFAMRIDVPTTLTTGSNTLTWLLVDGRVERAVATVPIEVL